MLGLVAVLMRTDGPTTFARDVALIAERTSVEILTNSEGARLALAPEWGSRVIASASALDAPSQAFCSAESWGEDELAVRGEWKIAKRTPSSISVKTRDLMGVPWVRTVRFLEPGSAWKSLAVEPVNGVQCVAYESLNTVTGSAPIRVVSRYPAGAQTTLVMPIHALYKRDYAVTDRVERSQYAVSPTHLFLKGDGATTGGLNVGRSSATGIFGSFDPLRQVLTVVQVSSGATYAARSENGLVRFESTLHSPMKSATLVQRTFHFTGDLKGLAATARKTLKCDVTELVNPGFWAQK